MENSQTPLDYKQYFNDKFISTFKDFVSYLSLNLNEGDELNAINNINNLKDKLDYSKIIVKMSQNTKIVEALTFLNKNNFDEEISKKLLNKTDGDKNNKFWILMPSFNISKILNNVQSENVKREIYERINSLHICAVTYMKVIEQLETTNDDKTFNPFNSVGEVADNVDVESLFKGVDVKNISAYEMLMETIINQQMDNKMGDYMNNIQEDDVNEAASKLHDVLNSENFQNNNGSSKILSDMLNNIKSEVINLKSDGDKMKGKQGVEQLLGIAQKVAGNMMGSIKESNVSVLDIWDATSNLAKNTVKSDALNIVDNLIRNNIQANMNKAQEISEMNNTSQMNGGSMNIGNMNENNNENKNEMKEKKKKNKKN